MSGERREFSGKPGNAGEGTENHEMLNGRLKNWGILSQVFRHHITRHGNVFWACVVVMQLTIQDGEPLFEVEYGD